MTDVIDRSAGPRHMVFALAIRTLALVDALALPAVLGYWVWSWHTPAPGMRFLMAFLVAYWAAKRTYAATVGFGTFKWCLTRLAAAVLVVWLLTRIGA